MPNSRVSSGNRQRQTLRAQKKQTRLQFAALASSSPAKAAYDPAVQARLASVRYEGARQTRKRTKNNVRADIPLTPEPSSQIQRNTSESPIATPNSPQSSFANDPDPQLNSDSSEDELNVILPSTKRRRIAADNDHIQKNISTPTRRSTRLSGQPTPLSSAARNRRAAIRVSDDEEESTQISELGSPETSGDENGILAARPAPKTTSASKRARWSKTENRNVESDYSDDIPRRNRTPRRENTGFDFIADDDEVEFITSDDSAHPKHHKKSTPLGSKTTKSPRSRRLKRRSEQKELDDDLADLQDSTPEDDTPRTRTRGGPVTTQKDKAREHLERLRRRRAGEEISRETSPVEPVDSEDEAVDMEFITQPPRGRKYVESSSASTDAEVDQIEDTDSVDEDEFIVDDSTGRLGRPNHDIPLEFTSFASAKPKELFVYIIEWLVKNKIAPAFPRRDQVYRLAFDRLNDQVTAQAGSRLISAAWVATFKHAVLARPGMTVEYMGNFGNDGARTCDACNRSNHPATYDFSFTGQAYDQDTLEPIDQSDDEEEDKTDDKQSHDAAGHELAPETRHFYLGSFCAANAEMGHKLTHWKHHLNQSLLEYLESQGVLSAEAILARDRMTQRKREREAEAIVDGMEAVGKIGELWRDFQDDLDDARLGMEDFEKKKGRGKGRVGNVRAFVRD